MMRHGFLRTSRSAHPLRISRLPPEADIEGEDLVVRTPSTEEQQGELMGVQLKPRVYVDGDRYSGLGPRMLVPIGPFTPDKPRPWFLVPHDPCSQK